MAKKRLPDNLQIWIDARKKYHLGHAHIQMARELGMNPKKFGRLANHKQEGWKLPLSQFTIRELSAHDVNRLLADKRFARLKPVTCSQCGEKTGFVRRIFEITGVTWSKKDDDQIQQLIRFHFKQRYSIDFIFFKTHGRQFFVDSAACGSCESTAIVYDIEFDHDLISELAKLTGRPEAQVKTALENTYAKVNKA